MEQLNRKKEIISGLDEKILTLTDEKDPEAEIVESEEALTSISCHITQVKCLLNISVSTQPSQKAMTVAHSEEHSPPHISKDKETVASAAVRENVIRLPRLNIPTFAGDALSWEPFWDSFDATVHSNSTLSAVQKLTYLRSQLQGSAAQVISGLTLTSGNYEHSISLLKDRFGQPHNLKHAHMQALLNLPSPTDTLSSLQAFYDTVEGHVRSLTSLGKGVETYSDLLITIIRSKLPSKAGKNIAQEHGSGEWTLEAIQQAIKQDIRILELEIQTNQTHSHPTASFHTGTSKVPYKTRQPESVKKHSCVFCKGLHTPTECTVVINSEQRRDAIRDQKLCFNCLGRHKVSQCTSRNRCHKCQRKHHTSICSTQRTMTYPEVHKDRITFLWGPTQLQPLMLQHRQFHLVNRLQV